jgi:hypothetical protein
MLPKQIPEVDLNLIHADPRIKRLIEKNDKWICIICWIISKIIHDL